MLATVLCMRAHTSQDGMHDSSKGPFDSPSSQEEHPPPPGIVSDKETQGDTRTHRETLACYCRCKSKR